VALARQTISIKSLPARPLRVATSPSCSCHSHREGTLPTFITSPRSPFALRRVARFTAIRPARPPSSRRNATNTARRRSPSRSVTGRPHDSASTAVALRGWSPRTSVDLGIDRRDILDSGALVDDDRGVICINGEYGDDWTSGQSFDVAPTAVRQPRCRVRQ